MGVPCERARNKIKVKTTQYYQDYDDRLTEKVVATSTNTIGKSAALKLTPVVDNIQLIKHKLNDGIDNKLNNNDLCTIDRKAINENVQSTSIIKHNYKSNNDNHNAPETTPSTSARNSPSSQLFLSLSTQKIIADNARATGTETNISNGNSNEENNREKSRKINLENSFDKIKSITNYIKSTIPSIGYSNVALGKLIQLINYSNHNIKNSCRESSVHKYYKKVSYNKNDKHRKLSNFQQQTSSLAHSQNPLEAFSTATTTTNRESSTSSQPTPHSSPSRLTNSTSSTTLSSSRYYVRNSLCFYAASSVILALIYFITPSLATTTPDPLHPM